MATREPNRSDLIMALLRSVITTPDSNGIEYVVQRLNGTPFKSTKLERELEIAQTGLMLIEQGLKMIRTSELYEILRSGVEGAITDMVASTPDTSSTVTTTNAILFSEIASAVLGKPSTLAGSVKNPETREIITNSIADTVKALKRRKDLS